jgi:hypothetical protein
MAKRVRFSFGTRHGMSKRRLLLLKRSRVRRPATSASGQLLAYTVQHAVHRTHVEDPTSGSRQAAPLVAAAMSASEG